jgi:predicted ATP-binding protein involved in virulence
MNLTRLRIENLRAFDGAEFEFSPGMNLLVGVNGVGKSTVLDALRILLSHVPPKFSASRGKKLPFEIDDIQVRRHTLTAELTFNFGGVPFIYEVKKNRSPYVANRKRTGQVRGQAKDTPDTFEWKPEPRKVLKTFRRIDEQPLAIYFSPRRSIPSMRKPSALSVAGERAAAYADALSHRELLLREFAEWWLSRERQAKKNNAPSLLRPLESLKVAAHTFLKSYTNLRAATKEKGITLLVNKGRTVLDVRQLSDGERGVLALVLDLARRLALANPKLKDPTHDGKAIVLIDELDLHLHPQWQRTIVQRLEKAFPNCQFIATTHSPQIVGAVEPEKIYILQPGSKPFQPDQSLGMDTNWLLKYLMGTEERDPEFRQELEEIRKLIDDEEDYEQAQRRLDKLKAEIGDFPELTRLQTRIDRFTLLEE